MKIPVPVTLVAIDTTGKPQLALRAIEKSLEHIEPQSVKLLTDSPDVKFSVPIKKLKGLEGYSEFCIRNLSKYVETSHCLVVQNDGYVVNGKAWSKDFLNWDFIGAPFNPSGIVGNGGFSLRSKRLLDYTAQANWQDCHPEDSALSVRHRDELLSKGFNIAPKHIAEKFSFEGRSWDSKEWRGTNTEWNGQFGFHSWLTKLPPHFDRPKIFHHSLDQGDLIYGLAAMKALGGGILFVSPDNRYPYPLASRWQRMGGSPESVDNLAPLIEEQQYVWGVKYTHGTPFSTDYDLNRFRLPWKQRTAKDFDSILKLHCDAFNVPLPAEPWLSVTEPITFPDRRIVVNRTERYQNFNFPWDKFLARWAEKMVFVGTRHEFELFRGFSPRCKLEYYPTNNALELARVIAGAKFFTGNQSLALAIAHGLFKPVLIEEWAGNPNCRMDRPNVFYSIPQSLL